MNMKIYEILQTGIIDRGKNFVFIVEKMYYISADYVIPWSIEPRWSLSFSLNEATELFSQPVESSPDSHIL